LDNSLTGSKRRYITSNNWQDYYSPEQLELIKQEFLYTNHHYDSFGKFLHQRYNFHPRQIEKGEFKAIFGSFADLAAKRREFLKTQQNEAIASGLVGNPPTIGKEMEKELEKVLDKKIIKQQIELVSQIKDHTIKAREAKEALMNTLYLISKKLEIVVKEEKGFGEVDSFIVQNIKNLKEIIDLLNSIERQGDVSEKLVQDNVKKVVLNKTEINNVNQINFQTVQPEELTVQPEELVQFSGRTSAVNS